MISRHCSSVNENELATQHINCISSLLHGLIFLGHKNICYQTNNFDTMFFKKKNPNIVTLTDNLSGFCFSKFVPDCPVFIQRKSKDRICKTIQQEREREEERSREEHFKSFCLFLPSPAVV